MRTPTCQTPQRFAPHARSLALVFAVVSTTVYADTIVEVRAPPDHTGQNLFLVNPGDLFSGVLSLEYERAVGRWFGVTGGFSVWSFRSVFSPPGTPTFTALSPEFGARVHFIRDSPGGLWVGPYVSAGYLIARSDGALTRAWSWGLGAAAGYNFIIGRVFTVQLGAGGGFTDYGDHFAWVPRLRLGLGFVF